MSFKNVLYALILSTFTVQSNAVDTCNFDFAIPGVGPSCEMKGGLPSTLFDKYEDVFGGVRGLKLIIDDTNGLSRIIQDHFSRIQREQQVNSQNINQIANEIQAVKRVLGIFPIDPPDNEQSGDPKAKIAKRAVDPYQALRDALNDAERKLSNMTRTMEESARRSSISFSTAEQMIQMQDLRLKSTLKRISDLEILVKQLPGNPQSTAGGISSLSFNTILNIATMSAKIQATTEIIQARVSDLNDRLREMEKPIQERQNKYQIVDSNLKLLQSGVSKITVDESSLQASFNIYKNNLTQDLAPIQRDMSLNKQKYATLVTDEQNVQTKIQHEGDLQQNRTNELQQALASLIQMKPTLAAFDPTVKNMTSEITTMTQDPIAQLAHVLSDERAAIQKMDTGLKQTHVLANVTIPGLLNLQQAKLAKIPVSG